MKTFAIQSAKLAIVFRAGELPDIDPQDPRFVLDLGGVKIAASVNAKAARELKVHGGGVVLQGRLCMSNGGLRLEDAGFSWIDPKPEPESSSLPLTPKS